MKTLNSRAFTLLEVLIALTVFLTIGVGLTGLMSNLYIAERGVASNADQTQLKNLIQLMTQSSESCKQTTLIGTDISPLLISPPEAVPVVLQFTSGALQTSGPALKANEFFGSKKIESLSLEGATHLKDNRYIVQLNLTTNTAGRALTTRNPHQSHILQIETDSTNKVINCQGSNDTSFADLDLSCVRVGTGWQTNLKSGDKLSVQCPEKYVGVSCVNDYYDTNAGVQYHGFAHGEWTQSRQVCQTQLNDGGISEGQLVAFNMLRFGEPVIKSST